VRQTNGQDRPPFDGANPIPPRFRERRRFHDRATGQLGDLPATFVELAGRLGARPGAATHAPGRRAIWFDNVGADPIDPPNAEAGRAGDRVTRLSELYDVMSE
jgi:hypothetical protein